MNSVSKSREIFLSAFSSNFNIINPPGILIGFVNSPTCNLLISFTIFFANWFSPIHPIEPPILADSVKLYIFAVFLKPISDILFFIMLYFSLIFFLFSPLKKISESR